MGKRSGDDKPEPSLELPSLKLPGLGRRGKRKDDADGTSQAAPSESASVPAPESSTEPTTVIEPQPAPVAPTETTTRRDRSPVVTAEPDAPPAPRRRARRPAAVPRLSGWVAAALTGLVVAVAGGAATYGGLAACEAARGVSSCGGGPGFLVLVAILALMILLGTALLRAFGVRDPGSTSFLAVGIVAVVVMLVLLDVVLSPWMFVVIPALTAAAFLVAHWVTTRFDESATGRRDWT